jgi:hypothetical protein
MSVPEAMNAYTDLAKKVFSEQTYNIDSRGSRYRASNLESAIKSILAETLGEGHDEDMMMDSTPGACKV